MMEESVYGLNSMIDPINLAHDSISWRPMKWALKPSSNLRLLRFLGRVFRRGRFRFLLLVFRRQERLHEFHRSDKQPGEKSAAGQCVPEQFPGLHFDGEGIIRHAPRQRG